jgi:hypothetical protein
MNKSKFSARHFFIVATVALCALPSCTAFAAEDSTSSKGRFTWNFNFGDHASFGSNRTKGSGAVKEEVRSVAGFTRLVLALPARVTLTQGATESLAITADDNLLPLMRTRVENGELVIDADKSRGFSTRQAIKIRLTVKKLDGILINGAGDVFGDQLTSDKLDISITGSGDVKIKSIRADQVKIGIDGSGDVSLDALDSKSVEASINGSGDVRLPSVQAASVKISVRGSGDVVAAGNVDTVRVDVVGSGDVRAKKLIAREVEVSITASGDAVVHASQKLAASVTGSGDIRYAGSPASVSRKVHGSGSIEPL